MAIKYEIQQIENAAGSGEARPYVRLHQDRAMTVGELAERVAESSTLTPGDVKAVMSELGHYAKTELIAGRRFHLPEIGYLSLSVGNVAPEQLPDGKITGRDVFVRNVDFKPEGQFLGEIRRKARFEKSQRATGSVRYDAEELWGRVKAYLSTNRYISCRIMSMEFGLTKYLSRQWLARFTQEGRIVKEGTARQPLYFLA